ncbi:hypothetical protein CCACVL1_19273 [Corchorus capsularis]|uniref:Uncharacterized protein n=1 Tax=Corchorus capsularis TaxID=210143 RepID=A0A1R3HHI7_COCAP|nr:hypothetical protein CCACVL1_19273 [Corchorus capsularis]
MISRRLISNLQKRCSNSTSFVSIGPQNHRPHFRFESLSTPTPKHVSPAVDFVRTFSTCLTKSKLHAEKSLTADHPYALSGGAKWISDQRLRYLSGGTGKPTGEEYPSQNPDFKHQEIQGPTVERDLSAVANETRQVVEATMKSIHELSGSLARLGLIQLALGAFAFYFSGRTNPITDASIQTFIAFGFPFTMALLLRQSLKPIYFFKKMEEQGRLQILTLTLQVAKNLHILFVRLRLLSFFCVLGVSVGFFFLGSSN